MTENNFEAWEDDPPKPQKAKPKVVKGTRPGLTKAEWDGRKTNEDSSIRWAFENLMVMDVSPADAPSAGAWGLLLWARSNPDDFYRLWTRILPNKAQIEQRSRFNATGSTDLELVERFRASLPSSGPQEVGEKRRLQA
jgi:hypothetical protein